jgi:hypothetical protein
MTKDMTQGSPLKLILAFAVPLMLGSLFQQFYNLADTIIVGRFVGVEALAAVGSVGKQQLQRAALRHIFGHGNIPPAHTKKMDVRIFAVKNALPEKRQDVDKDS